MTNKKSLIGKLGKLLGSYDSYGIPDYDPNEECAKHELAMQQWQQMNNAQVNATAYQQALLQQYAQQLTPITMPPPVPPKTPEDMYTYLFFIMAVELFGVRRAKRIYKTLDLPLKNLDRINKIIEESQTEEEDLNKVIDECVKDIKI